jgi:D-hydroxyproline dehydrogenase subunit gamma
VTKPDGNGSGRQPQFLRLKSRTGGAVRFFIDGQPAEAAKGDTLLTAILLNVHYVRRFEFGDSHRAGFCIMGACQDCWVQLADGSRTRACTTLVAEGMSVITNAATHV